MKVLHKGGCGHTTHGGSFSWTIVCFWRSMIARSPESGSVEPQASSILMLCAEKGAATSDIVGATTEWSPALSGRCLPGGAWSWRLDAGCSIVSTVAFQYEYGITRLCAQDVRYQRGDTEMISPQKGIGVLGKQVGCASRKIRVEDGVVTKTRGAIHCIVGTWS